MRCPDCAKFVSFGELNTDSVEVSLDGTTITLSGSMTLPCSECGTDLAEAGVDTDLDTESLFVDAVAPDKEAGETVEYELDGDPDLEAGDTGGGRYAKKYYTVTANGTVMRKVCDKEGKEIEGKSASAEYSLEASEQASAFESLV